MGTNENEAYSRIFSLLLRVHIDILRSPGFDNTTLSWFPTWNMPRRDTFSNALLIPDLATQHRGVQAQISHHMVGAISTPRWVILRSMSAVDRLVWPMLMGSNRRRTILSSMVLVWSMYWKPLLISSVIGVSCLSFSLRQEASLKHKNAVRRPICLLPKKKLQDNVALYVVYVISMLHCLTFLSLLLYQQQRPPVQISVKE